MKKIELMTKKETIEFLIECSQKNQVEEWNNLKSEYNKLNVPKLDLSRIDLSNQNLSNFDLSRVNLSNSNLNNINLINANLIDSDLSYAYLNNADLDHSILKLTKFNRATIKSSNLNSANISSADFTYADLSNSNLQNSNLTMCLFNNTTLVNTTLSSSDLSGSDCTQSIFKNSNLSLSNLIDSDFSNSDLTNVNLTGAFLDKAIFNNTILPNKYLYLKINSDNNIVQQLNIKSEILSLQEKINQLEKDKDFIVKTNTEKSIETKEFIEEKDKTLETYKQQIKKLSIEQENYILNKQEETKIIQKTISSLNVKTKEVEEKRNYILKRINFFNNLGKGLLLISLIFSCIYIFCIYHFMLSNKDIKIVTYLSITFPIFFPIIISFLSFRQSNIKEHELKEIDMYYTYIHNIDSALNALNQISSGKHFISKIEDIIYKIIDNTLENNRYADQFNTKNENYKMKEELGYMNNTINELTKNIINTVK